MNRTSRLRTLAEKFERGGITAPEFERAFLGARRESGGLPFGRRARLHDALFALVERYCADSALRTGDDLDDDGLHRGVSEVLRAQGG